MAAVTLGWLPGDDAQLTKRLFTDDPPFVTAASVADRFLSVQATDGDNAVGGNHRELYEVDGTTGMEFARILCGPHMSWYQGGVATPQHGLGLRYQESGGKRRMITLWQNIFAGFWWTMNLGVWTANLDGSGFVNRQVQSQITPLVHTVNVIGAGAARSGGIVSAPIAAGHLLRVGDPIHVDLANAAFDGLFSVVAVEAERVYWAQAGADDATGGTGIIRHTLDFWLDIAVDPGTNVAHMRAWKDLTGQAVPEWTTLDTDAGVILNGGAGTYVSQPDAAALRLTGTLTMVMDCTPADWTPAIIPSLMSKYGTTNPSAQRAFRYRILQNGRIEFTWSTNGTTGTAISTTNPLEAQANATRRAVACTFIPNDGAGGKRVRVLTAPTHKGPWTLHEEITQAGTTTVFAGTAPLEVGAVNSGGAEPFAGRVHYAALKSGDLDTGTVVAELVPQVSQSGSATLADLTSLANWTVHGVGVHENTGFPAGTVEAFSVDLDMAGSAASRAANPTPDSGTEGPAGVVVAHLGTDMGVSRVSYGWGRFGDSVAALAGAPPGWPPAGGGIGFPRARWRRRGRR